MDQKIKSQVWVVLLNGKDKKLMSINKLAPEGFSIGIELPLDSDFSSR